jgi:hypothetical protein
MLDSTELLELAIKNTRPGMSTDAIRKDIEDPPLGRWRAWGNTLPDALFEIWDELSLDARIVAFWMAERAASE